MPQEINVGTNFNIDENKIISVNGTENIEIFNQYFCDNIVNKVINNAVNENNNESISQLVNETCADTTDGSV